MEELLGRGVAETEAARLFELANQFILFVEKLFLCLSKEKVTKRKDPSQGRRPAKKHPVSIAGGARPCAPGFHYPLIVPTKLFFSARKNSARIEYSKKVLTR